MRRFSLVCCTMILSCSVASVQAQQTSTKPTAKTLIYVGDYQNRISILSLDDHSGKLTMLSQTKVADRPSYILTDATGEYLYAVSEFTSEEKKWSSGSVAAYKLNKKTGELMFLNSQRSGGIPCYLSIDHKRRFLLCACFGGSVHVYPIAADGHLEPAATEIKYEPVLYRDKRWVPRPHSIVLSPDEKYVFVADRGRNRILQYRFDVSRGTLTPNDPAELLITDPGPRHLTFHPSRRFAYLINEPTATVVALEYDKIAGTLKQNGLYETVHAHLEGPRGGAEIAVSNDGKFLYASSRNQNSLLVAEIDSARGTLTKAGIFNTKGVTPRTFALASDDRFLLVAHRRSDEIISFRRDRTTGKLAEASRFRITKEAAPNATGAVRIGVVSGEKAVRR